MEIKHQVFVSSTYRDLIEERKAVIHALLELDCIPAGMELFPATNEDAWTLIKEVIDGCDYYILILAGKYGSQSPAGIGFTEMEFDYAVSSGKPVIVFLHANIDELPSAAVERSDEARAKLEAFRNKASAKHCKFWASSEDLGAKVSRSMVQLKKKHPSPGWVPGRFAATEAMLREMQELRTRVAELELAALSTSSSQPLGTELLAQGEDTVEYSATVFTDSAGRKTVEKELTISWDHLFSYVGPRLLHECTDDEMMEKVRLAYFHELSDDEMKFNKFDHFLLSYVFEDKVRVQLQALGLIARGERKRAVADKAGYWKLTQYGERYLISIKAERKTGRAI